MLVKHILCCALLAVVVVSCSASPSCVDLGHALSDGTTGAAGGVLLYSETRQVFKSDVPRTLWSDNATSEYTPYPVVEAWLGVTVDGNTTVRRVYVINATGTQAIGSFQRFDWQDAAINDRETVFVRELKRTPECDAAPVTAGLPTTLTTCEQDTDCTMVATACGGYPARKGSIQETLVATRTVAPCSHTERLHDDELVPSCRENTCVLDIDCSKCDTLNEQYAYRCSTAGPTFQTLCEKYNSCGCNTTASSD